MRRKARSFWAFGLVPSLLLALHFWWFQPGQPGAGFQWEFATAAAWFSYKVGTLYKQLSPFSLFDPFFVSFPLLYAMVAANALFVLGLVYVVVEKTRLAFRVSNAAPSVVARRVAVIGLTAAFLISPRGFVGLVNPGERLVLPMVVLALSLPHASRLPTFLRGFSAPALALLLLCQLSLITVQGQRAAAAMRTVVDEMDEVRGALALIHESHFKDASVPPRPSALEAYSALPRHYPLLRAALYGAQPGGPTVPVFETGLFRGTTPDLLLRDIEEASAQTTDVLIVGEPIRVNAIAMRIRGHRTIAQGEYYALLRHWGTSRYYGAFSVPGSRSRVQRPGPSSEPSSGLR